MRAGSREHSTRSRIPLRTRNPKVAGVLIAVASACCFGGSGPFAKPLIEAGLSPLSVTWLRVAGGALLMVPFAIRHAGVVRRAPKLLLAYGLVAIAGVQGFYFAAIASIPVGVALLIEFLGPVMVLGWSRFVLRRPVPPRAAIGVALAVAGLAGVVQVWSGLSFDPLGLLLALGAACCQAAYFILADTGAEVDPRGLAAYGLLVGAAVLTLIVRPWSVDWSVLGGTVTLSGHGLPAVVAVVWIVLASTVLAYLTGILAVRRLSAPIAGAIAYLEPVVATVLAWWLLGEQLGAVQLTGGALVLVGAYVAQRSATATARTRAEPASEAAH